MLAPGGTLLDHASRPATTGDFDAAVRSGALPISRSAGLRRVPGRNEWHEVAPDDVFSAPYDFLPPRGPSEGGGGGPRRARTALTERPTTGSRTIAAPPSERRST